MARRRAPPILIPEPVTRALALHGPVALASGLGASRVSLSCAFAPFDDLLVFFVAPGAPLLPALERAPRAELQAAGPDNRYLVRMSGRAVDAGPAAGHERRLELIHWLPERSVLGAFRAVEFLPERIEYAYDEGEDRRHFEGATAESRGPSRTALCLEACFGGVVPSAAVACAALWAWVGWYGRWYDLRTLALVLSLLTALGLLAAGRLLFRCVAFRAWQAGRADRRHAGPIARGLLPLRSCQQLAVGLAGLASLCCLAAGLAWGPALVGVSLGASQLWYLVPWWAVRPLGGAPRRLDRG